MIFDLHCDTFMKLRHAKARGQELSLADAPLQINERKLVQGGYFAQCFAMFTNKAEDDSYAVCKTMIDRYDEELSRSNVLKKVLRFEDFAKNEREGKISSVLTMEDASPIEESLEKLKEFYDRGVRMIGLTWNYINAVGYPNLNRLAENADVHVPETENGLTEFGRECVKEMNGLGIVVDVSHLSDKGFYDVIETSERPIVASHSNARSVCGHVRNLTDDMLKKLADNGGVAGMNYAAAFIDDDPQKGADTVEGLLVHIKYIKRKIGVEHIAIGSDFDGIDPNIRLKDATYLPTFVEAMERSGFTADEIDKITYKNALRVFKENMK